MNNIPTAREFYDQHHSDDAVIMMIEFAKIHCEAQLNAILKNSKVLMRDYCHDHTPYRGECDTCGCYHNYKIATEEVDENSIIDAYPLTNIK
jgi:hypothetical protein